MVDSLKLCRKCGTPKALDRFYKRSKNPQLRRSICKDCDRASFQRWCDENPGRHNASCKRWQVSNPEKFRSIALRHKYGVSLEEYNDMVSSQKGLCAICGKPETAVDPRSKKVMALSVDHDHLTKTVRQLLCAKCNKGIGMFADDVDVLLAAVEYLLKHRGNHVEAS